MKLLYAVLIASILSSCTSKSGPTSSGGSGGFRIDKSRLEVSPNSLFIQSGDTATLLFKIDYEAPAGGLAIDVKTNIPNSVIIPEAIIPEGDMTVYIPVKGGESGEGKLIISAPGFESTEVSIKVF